MLHIHGINIPPHEVKLAQYADDTTAVLEDTQSAQLLISLLLKFEKISGLKINQSKTEAMWIGSKRNNKDKPLNVKWPVKPIRLLGIWFTHDESASYEYNFQHLLASIEKIIHIWKRRDLTVYGKTIVAKTFLLPKLTFALTMLTPPKTFLQQVERLIARFIWNGVDKIKRRASYNSYENGGINMLHLESWMKALKLIWIKRFMNQEVTAAWKGYLLWLLKQKGGTLFLHCNFDSTCTVQDEFYKDVINIWGDLKQINCVEDGRYIIWNNKEVKINNRTVYYGSYHNSGILMIWDLYKNPTNKETFEYWQGRGCQFGNYLKWLGLRSAGQPLVRIHKGSKDVNKEDYLDKCTTLRVQNEKYVKLTSISTKQLYSLIVRQTLLPPSSFERLKEKFRANEDEIKWSFSFIHQKISEVKLKDFQFRCLHFILNVKYILKKKKLIEDDLCTFCHNERETTEHLFVNCPIAQRFWVEFIHYWNNMSQNQIRTLNPKDIYLGLKGGDDFCNFLLILGKKHLYLSSQKQLLPSMERFILLCNEKRELEHEIAKKNNNMEKFKKKWDILPL